MTLLTIGSCALLLFIFGSWMLSVKHDQNYYLSQIRELNAKLNERENTIRNLRDGIERLAAVAGCFNRKDGAK